MGACIVALNMFHPGLYVVPFEVVALMNIMGSLRYCYWFSRSDVALGMGPEVLLRCLVDPPPLPRSVLVIFVTISEVGQVGFIVIVARPC